CLLLENRPDFIVHWLALNGIGVSIVPINPAYRAAEIEYLIAQCADLPRNAAIGQFDAIGKVCAVGTRGNAEKGFERCRIG
ncbi:hypothetical protein, partial [Bradyrhizobium brasilense]|uniref:hypothetical protein n=1 Tax=Bradyrhizobium brasilense TaxID=1419277 RepID=UPI001AEE3C7C